MLSNRRLALLLLGLAGVLVVHQFAHGLTRILGLGASSVDHGHMAVLWATLGPLGALGLAVLAVRQTRAIRLEQPVRTSRLTALTACGYVALEMAEHLGSALSIVDALTAPSVLLGVLLAPLVGLVLRRAVSGAAAIIEALTEGPGRRPPGRPLLLRITSRGQVVPVDPARFSHRRRGPPRR